METCIHMYIIPHPIFMQQWQACQQHIVPSITADGMMLLVSSLPPFSPHPAPYPLPSSRPHLPPPAGAPPPQTACLPPGREQGNCAALAVSGCADICGRGLSSSGPGRTPGSWWDSGSGTRRGMTTRARRVWTSAERSGPRRGELLLSKRGS